MWLSFNSLGIFANFFVTFVLLLQCIHNGAAIKCFVCDSSDNPSCADLKSNSSIVAEECTLDKMKSINTWLFDLNKFSYFDNGANRSPVMNCQKVVARDTKTSKMVTARFCQLDTGDTDACSILRAKLSKAEESHSQRNKKKGKQAQSGGGADVDEEEEFHCSICSTDCCNGSMPSVLLLRRENLLLALFLFFMTQQWRSADAL